MTPYPLFSPKVHPLSAHTKNKVFGVKIVKNSKNSMTKLTNVGKPLYRL